MWGGGGKDRFDFNALSETPNGVANRDIIRDFDHSEKDIIDLATIDAKAGVVGNQAFTFIGNQAFHDVKGELRFSATMASSREIQTATEFPTSRSKSSAFRRWSQRILCSDKSPSWKSKNGRRPSKVDRPSSPSPLRIGRLAPTPSDDHHAGSPDGIGGAAR